MTAIAPLEELRRVSMGDRWCFGCRKHLPHDEVLLGSRGPSFVEPVWVRRCSSCGEDRTWGFGCGPL